MKKHHDIKNVRIEKDHLDLSIDGQEKTFLLKEISQRLLQATQGERDSFKISPSGYGIHWPLLDEDISIDALLGIAHKPDLKRGIA